MPAFISSWLPPAIWCGLIFYFSSIPGLNSGLGVWDLILRKCAHMVEFGVLALMLARASRRTWTSLAPGGVTALAFALSVAYAASDEFHQAFVPNRGPSPTDVLFDTAGVILALFVVRRWFAACRRERVVASAKSFLLLACVLSLSGCGADAEFKRAKGAEAAGRSYEAWQKYQAFAARRPEHARAAEAVFRAGWLAETVLRDCDVAETFYQRVSADYPGSAPWAGLAELQAANCPDYFPLVPGASWVEGDSESGGKNARIETSVEAATATANVPFSSAVFVRDYYGGNAKFRTTRTLYRKDGATVWEHGPDGAAPRAVLRGPLVEGARWTGDLAGRTFRYEVASTSETVTVRAGTFAGCLLITAKAEGVPGATNEYYAPYVGRILTTFSSGGGNERRNTELLSHKPGDRERFLQ